RPRGGVEQQQFEELLTPINGVRLVPMGDRLTWKLSSSGEFSVASVRRLINDKTLPDADQKTRWVRYVPIKVNVIAWKVKSYSLPTRFNISRRGIPLDSIKCGICDTGVETASHLFFSCDLVCQLVRLIARWWDVPYVGVVSYADWASWMENLRLSFKNKLMLEGVFYVLWWYAWTFRNKMIFDTKIPMKATLFDDIVTKSYFWTRYRCKASFCMNDWLKNPRNISM
nr:RNA-directed DNA polymerase, eukaryota [Tanacetum cinerariifolium]